MMTFLKKMVLLTVVCCYTIASNAQNTLITGKVLYYGTDAPIVGASVTIKGTTRGVFTDEYGQYTLNTKVKNPILIVKYKGHGTIEQMVNAHGMIKVAQNFELVNKLAFLRTLKARKEREQKDNADTKLSSNNIP